MKQILESPRRLIVTVIVAALGAVLGLGLALVIRSGGGETRLDAQPARPGPTASPTDDRLIPPTPEITTESTPDVDYGSPAPIALEAVQAFLDNDHARFSSLATQEVVEAVNAAPDPRPGQAVLGDVETVLPGPTEQTMRIMTTDGTLEVVMTADAEVGGWLVSDMRYVGR